MYVTFNLIFSLQFRDFVMLMMKKQWNRQMEDKWAERLNGLKWKKRSYVSLNLDNSENGSIPSVNNSSFYECELKTYLRNSGYLILVQLIEQRWAYESVLYYPKKLMIVDQREYACEWTWDDHQCNGEWNFGHAKNEWRTSSSNILVRYSGIVRHWSCIFDFRLRKARQNI